jgi:hypothetical protein
MKYLKEFVDWLNSDPIFDAGNPFDLMRAELQVKPHPIAVALMDHALANAERHYNQGNMRDALLTVWNVARVLHAQTDVIAKATATQIHGDASKTLGKKRRTYRKGTKTTARTASGQAFQNVPAFRRMDATKQQKYLEQHHPEAVKGVEIASLSRYVRDFRDETAQRSK